MQWGQRVLKVLQVQRGGAAHNIMEAPRRFETSGFLVSQT